MGATEAYAKEKIGSHLSYPLKFGEVVSLLSPVVEQLNIQVWFNAWKAPRQNEQRERYEVMEAGYWDFRGDAPWHLFVKPVPRVLRATIRQVLIPEATDRVRDWFLRRPFKARGFRVYFRSADETIEYDPA